MRGAIGWGLQGVSISFIALGGLRCAPSVPGAPAPSMRATRNAGAGAGPAGGAQAPPEAGADGARDATHADTAPDVPPDAPRSGDESGDAVSPDGVTDGRAESPAVDAPGAPPPGPGDLVIDEILVDPAGNDLGREWVEIANVSGHELDLSDLHLSDGTTDVAADGGSLPEGGLLLLGQSIDPTKNGGAPVQVAYATRLQLNNGGDMLAVCLGACAGGLVLDAFSWDASLGAGYVGHAIVVDRAAGTICPAAQPFGTGGSFGTPGTPNPPCATPPGSEPDAGEPDAGEPDAGQPDSGLPDGGLPDSAGH